jgi:hypothetical protein
MRTIKEQLADSRTDLANTIGRLEYELAQANVSDKQRKQLTRELRMARGVYADSEPKS